jgi:hypothetical protein
MCCFGATLQELSKIYCNPPGAGRYAPLSANSLIYDVTACEQTLDPKPDMSNPHGLLLNGAAPQEPACVSSAAA